MSYFMLFYQLFSLLFSFPITSSSNLIYRTGLKKCVIQKTSFISSDISSVKTLSGIEDVFDETKAPGFRKESICEHPTDQGYSKK